MESLEGVDRMLLSGTRATLVLEPGRTLAEADVVEALVGQGLQFESLREQQVERAAAAYVAKTPGFT